MARRYHGKALMGNGYTIHMSIRTILPIAAVTALALMPSVALAYFEVNANGFHRVVVGSIQNGSCEVHRMTDGRLIRCSDGAHGTLTLYQDADGTPACEVDFWYQSGSSGRPWHIELSHQNSSQTCATQWQGSNTLNVNASQ
jgi:hypothetical protein